MNTTNKIQWNRPVENKYGHLVYTSKDGRFSVTRRSYVLPTVSTGYVLEGQGVPRWARENDLLADAKMNAQDIVDSESETVVKV
jgi:hypothetical protein